jgi:retron-type reverse transcriptase
MQAKVSGKRRKEMTEECLMDAILHPLNLQYAQEAVRRNKGCAGIDGKSIAETEQHWQQHLPEIETKLRTGAYPRFNIFLTYKTKRHLYIIVYMYYYFL